MPSTDCTNGSALANKRAARAVDKNCCQVSMKLSLLAYNTLNKGCGNAMPDLSNLVPFHSGQVENFN